MIVLALVHASPDRWKMFVANRVTEIQSLSRGDWNHVPSEENPADILSRGMSASSLQNSTLWWTGPVWLSHGPNAWPATWLLPSGLPEERAVVCSAVETKDEPELAVLLKYSSYSRLLRVLL